MADDEDVIIIAAPVEANQVMQLLSDDELIADLVTSIAQSPDYAMWSSRRIEARANNYTRMVRAPEARVIPERCLPVLKLDVVHDLPGIKDWLKERRALRNQEHAMLLSHSVYAGEPDPRLDVAFMTAIRQSDQASVRVLPGVDPITVVGVGVIEEGCQIGSKPNRRCWISAAHTPPAQHQWLRSLGKCGPTAPYVLLRSLQVEALTHQSVRRLQATASAWIAPEPEQDVTKATEGALPRKASHASAQRHDRGNTELVINDAWVASDQDVVAENITVYVEDVSREAATQLDLNEADVVEGAVQEIVRAIGYRNISPEACTQIVQDCQRRVGAVSSELKKREPPLSERQLQLSEQQAARVAACARIAIEIQVSLLAGPLLDHRRGHTLFGPPLEEDATSDDGLLALMAATTSVPPSVLRAEISSMLTQDQRDRLARVRQVLGKKQHRVGEQPGWVTANIDHAIAWPHRTSPASAPQLAVHETKFKRDRRGADALHLPDKLHPLRCGEGAGVIPAIKAAGDLISAVNKANAGITLPATGPRLQALIKAVEGPAAKFAFPDDVLHMRWLLTRWLPMACQRAATLPRSCEKVAALDEVDAYLCEAELSDTVRAGFARVAQSMCNQLPRLYASCSDATVMLAHAKLIVRRMAELDEQLVSLAAAAVRRRALQSHGDALQNEFQVVRETDKQKRLAKMASLDASSRAIAKQLKDRGALVDDALISAAPAPDAE